MRADRARSVVPAKAGTHPSAAPGSEWWIPASAGITCVLVIMLIAAGLVPARAAEPVSDRQILHILDRLAFGPTAQDIEHVKQIGLEPYIDEQLDPAAIEEPAALTEKLAAFDTLKLDPVQLFAEYGPLRPANGARPDPEEQKARRQRARVILEEARDARILRALYSRRQLQEVMVDFWFNHFNVSWNKSACKFLLGDYESATIRPHVLGKFRDLLGAVAKSPAMLIYLDNAYSMADPRYE